MTIGWAIRTAHNTLSKSHIPMAYLDVELILAFILKKDRSYIIAHNTDILTPSQFKTFQTLVKKRAKRMPLAYILGSKEWYGMTFMVSPDTLIPRPDTETLLQQVLDYIHNQPRVRTVADVGTGSGCIPLALAQHTPKQISIDAYDVSVGALRIARNNAKQLHLASRVHFLKRDLLKGVKKNYDIIVSNPPYLSRREYAHAVRSFPEIRYEPKSALISGKDGLDHIRILLSQVPLRLKKHGALFIEIGYEQGISVSTIAQEYLPKAVISVIKDDCDRDRVVYIQT